MPPRKRERVLGIDTEAIIERQKASLAKRKKSELIDVIAEFASA